jgi:hypothetical protein
MITYPADHSNRSADIVPLIASFILVLGIGGPSLADRPRTILMEFEILD